MMKGAIHMMAALMHMFSGTPSMKEETIFDIEFTEEHIIDGVYCQVQFNFTPLPGNDSIGVDWGDGTAQDWPKTQTLLAHNWEAQGRYRVKFDRRLKWFRFMDAYAIDKATGRVRAVVRPCVYPVQWGDFVESAKGTYCGWRGVKGPIIPWGRSMKDAYCCYQYCANVTGGFPKWGPSFTDCTGVYDTCPGLSGPIPPWPENATASDQCYKGTGATGVIPAWPETMTSARMCYQGCTGLTGAWTEDPVLLMPDRMNGQEGKVTDHDDVVLDAGEQLRALFYEDWGGTKARPE